MGRTRTEWGGEIPGATTTGEKARSMLFVGIGQSASGRLAFGIVQGCLPYLAERQGIYTAEDASLLDQALAEVRQERGRMMLHRIARREVSPRRLTAQPFGDSELDPQAIESGGLFLEDLGVQVLWDESAQAETTGAAYEAIGPYHVVPDKIAVRALLGPTLLDVPGRISTLNIAAGVNSALRAHAAFSTCPPR